MGCTVLSTRTIMRKVSGSIPGSGPDWKIVPVHPTVKIGYLLYALEMLP